MVVGLRTNNRKGISVQVDYLIHVQEIKPWPPLQSLRSLHYVLLQWENGDRSSGCTSTVVPTLGSGVGDGKIEFNEYFRLPVTLSRDLSVKSGNADTFQKNCLEFNLYEPRREKSVNSELLGTVIIDLADYGIVKESTSISTPMSCKRSFRNTAQPVLFIKIQPFNNVRSSSSSRDILLKEASLDKDGRESASALMNEEYAEDAEFASFTDYDVSSHSTLTNSFSAFEATAGSPPQNEENGSEAMKDSTGRDNGEPALSSEPVPAKSEVKPVTATYKHLNGISSRSLSIDLSCDLGSPVNDNASLSSFPGRSMRSMAKKSVTHSVPTSFSSIAYEVTEEEANNSMRSFDQDNLPQDVHEKVANDRSKIKGNAQLPIKENVTDSLAAKVTSSDKDVQLGEKPGLAISADSHVNREDDGKAWRHNRYGSEEAASCNGSVAGLMEEKYGEKQEENGHEEHIREEKKVLTEDEPLNKFPRDALRKQVTSGSNTLAFSRRALGVDGNILTSVRLKHVKSVRSPLDSARSYRSVSDNQGKKEVMEIDILENAHSGARSFTTNEKKDANVVSSEAKKTFSDSKIQRLECRIEMLEAELREAAAVEAGLYMIVAEHGSSRNKVHTPARRLARLYFHACKERSEARRASAARNAVSGFVLVAKACGNDVPRLMFWLSNVVVLRAIISQVVGDSQLPLSVGPHIDINGGGEGNDKRSPLKWKESSSRKKVKKIDLTESFDDWEDSQTFTTALGKIEAWIFSRIIESVWWQTMTPHMQSTAGQESDRSMVSSSRKTYGRRSNLGDQEQGNSLDLWKKAFKEACERLCPVRAGGHACGCLPMLARLVMEQCVGRLDVAMFNALLRESADEVPTDPVSDPIIGSKVLPVPARKSSFGVGAQLKKAIGNWSRWLADLFDIDDDDLPKNENWLDDDRQEHQTSFKSFHLLNALSDLMMLPKDMLLNKSIRKEVCPTFGAPLIKRVLNNFVPDEFCPDPIPEVVLEALDSEDSLEAEGSITNLPCIAAPTIYSPPSAASLAGIIGEVRSQSQLRRSGSSVLRKSYTSDNELDELDTSLTSIIIDSFQASPTTIPNWTPKGNGGRNAVRYQLLREVWRSGE